jgi:DNA replication protein DnaC
MEEDDLFLSSMGLDLTVDKLKAAAKQARIQSGNGCEDCDYFGHTVNSQGKAVLCHCFRDRFCQAMYATANVPKAYLKKELFDWNVNADSDGNDLGREKKTSQQVYTLLQFYAKNLNNIINGNLPKLTHSENKVTKLHSILFKGGIGSGKTFIASIMVKEAIKKNLTSSYFEWSELAQTLGDFNEKDAIEEIADKFKNNDFIVLDGIENYPYFTPYFFVQLDRICKLRLNSGKPIMMFSNGTHDKIKAGSGWASLLKSCLLIKLPQILS